jgi:hypothetical protein
VDFGGVRKAIAALRLARPVSVTPNICFSRGIAGMLRGMLRALYVCQEEGRCQGCEQWVDWIILRPSALTDNPGTGSVSLNLANFHTTITRDDLALSVIELLHTPAITRKILEVTEGDQLIASAVSTVQLARIQMTEEKNYAKGFYQLS